MTTANRIILKKRSDRHHEEYNTNSTGAAYPGMTLQMNSDGTVQPYSVVGGKPERLVAIEDSMIGNTIATQYANSSALQAFICDTGDVIAAYCAAGTPQITEGAYLQMDGLGGVQPVVGSAEVLYAATAASTAITNTTAATTFSNGTAVIPANELQVGDNLHVVANGTCPSTNSTDTLAITLVIGTSTVLLTLPALDVANNDIFQFEANLTVRSISGTTCTIVGDFTYTIGTPGTATEKNGAIASFTINSTIANNLFVQATWSVANAGDQTILQVYEVNLLRGAGTSMLVALETPASMVSQQWVAARWL